METLLAVAHLILISLFCWWYWRRQELPLRKFYWHAVAAKLSAGILVGVVFAVTYAASDTFSLFEWSKELSFEARRDFGWYLNYMWNGSPGGYYLGVERTIFFVKFTSVFALLTYDHYWISSLYFSLFSFLAAWRLTKVIWQQLPQVGIPAVMAFLFFPSCVFWASGITKEALAMAGLYFIAALFLQIWWKQKISVINVVAAIFVIWVTWNLKYYYIGLLMPVLVTTWVTRKIVTMRGIDGFFKETLLWFSLLIVMVLLASLAHPNFALHRIMSVLVTNNAFSLQVSHPDNVIHYYQLTDTWWSVTLNTPWALISGLFRPFVWEADSLLKLIVAAENLILLVLAGTSLRFLGKIRSSPNRLLVLAVIVYAVVLCVFLAISTPNFGTLARYRIGFLPFLLVLLVNQPWLVRALAKLFNVHIADLSR
jgi:hypothetical protein